MAKALKDIGSLAQKFSQRAAAAAPDYTSGVSNAGTAWDTGTKAGNDNYKQGVQQSIADDRYAKGVAKGHAKYVQRASTLGAQRYPSGVQAAGPDWAKNAQPYIDAARSMQLPPRAPKGDPRNQARASAVATRLRAMKTGKA